MIFAERFTTYNDFFIEPKANLNNNFVRIFFKFKPKIPFSKFYRKR